MAEPHQVLIDLEFILTQRAPVLRYPRAVLLADGCERHVTWDGKCTYYTFDGVIDGLPVHASGSTQAEAKRAAAELAKVVNTNGGL